METVLYNISDLQPEQREAAEKLLGRSLVDFEKVAVRVLEGGSHIVIRFFGGQQRETNVGPAGKWHVPSCFDVLTDLGDKERAEFDAVVSQPVRLSRPA